MSRKPAGSVPACCKSVGDVKSLVRDNVSRVGATGIIIKVGLGEY